MFEKFSLFIGLVALLSIVNYRWIKLPYTIAMLVLSLILVTALQLARPFMPSVFPYLCSLIEGVSFENVLFNGMLSFLLFAGAMQIQWQKLAREKGAVILFASLGVLLSTALVGGMIGLVARYVFDLALPWVYAFLFGALISPTDPIAVLAILKNTKVSESLMLKIEGESLFNDGIGVVVFSGIALLLPQATVEPATGSTLAAEISLLFVHEALGGLAFGMLLGIAGYGLIHLVCDAPRQVVLVSVAIATGGYALAGLLGVSGPLAMVVAGLWVGNKLHLTIAQGLPENKLMKDFWGVIEMVLNGVLFVMMGLQLHLLNFQAPAFYTGLLAIPLVLLARFISIKVSYGLLRHRHDPKPRRTVLTLTWGGLRGGISIALSLSLLHLPYGPALVLITFIVVIFSVVFQGLSIGPLVKRLYQTQ